MAGMAETPLWQKGLAAVIILGLAGWAAHNYAFKPKIKEINEHKKALAFIEKELAAKQAKSQIIIEKGKERDLLKEEFEALEKKIPYEPDIPYLLNQFIYGVGRNLDITYKLIRPSNPVAEGKYKRLPLKIDLEGTYGDLILYFLQIENLMAIIRVDGLSIVRVMEPKLAISLDMSAFVLPGLSKMKTKEAEPLTDKEISYVFVPDPFFPEKAKVGLPKDAKGFGPWDLQFKGIWKGKKTKVLIDDQILEKGQSIKGYKIIDIEDKRVTISKGGRKYILRLEEG